MLKRGTWQGLAKSRGENTGRSLLSFIRSAVIVGAAMVLVGALSACVPEYSFYLVNRDGHFYAGDHCSHSIAQAAVFLEAREGATRDFSQALWHAVADPPVVQEFEVFAANQPGVSVVWDDETYPTSEAVWVVIVDSKGREGGRLVVLDMIDVDSLSTGQSWDDYWSTPNSVYGC